MLSNGRRFELGNPLAVAIPVLLRWGLPFLLVSGGMLVTSEVVKKTFPEVPFNQKNIGKASLIGGAGVASYMFADVLPDAYKPIGYALGVVGVGISLYLLLTPPEKEGAVPNPYVPSGEIFPPLTPGPLLTQFNVLPDAEQKTTGGWRRWPYNDQTFEIVVENFTNQTITFFTGVGMYPSGYTRDYIYRTPPVDVNYGRTKWTVPAGGSERIKVTVPPWSQLPRQGGENNFAVDFEFFRSRDDREPFKVSAPITINYSFGSFLGNGHSLAR